MKEKKTLPGNGNDLLLTYGADRGVKKARGNYVWFLVS